MCVAGSVGLLPPFQSPEAATGGGSRRLHATRDDAPEEFASRVVNSVGENVTGVVSESRYCKYSASPTGNLKNNFRKDQILKSPRKASTKYFDLASN